MEPGSDAAGRIRGVKLEKIAALRAAGIHP